MRARWTLLTAVMVLLVVAASWCDLNSVARLSADAPQSNAKSGDTPAIDYKSQLPPVPAPDPQAAIRAMQLRPGFEVQLVAAEPLVTDPVALDIDENGKMYVVQFSEYNQYANPNFTGPKNEVKLLIDKDGDGQYDLATVFCEIPNATAVGCYDGGVFVGAAPDIFYCKDTNGDGKADVTKKVFSGFGADHAGEGMINSFRWGPDNKFYVSAGTDGGNIARPDDKSQAPISVRKRVFIFDPRTLRYDYTSGGGQHGMCLDDWGRIYACANSDPSFLAMYDERYLARNPYVTAPPAMETISTNAQDRMLHRISPIENWRILRTELRATGRARGPIEAGPAGHFTSGTGVTIYRGDAWPQQFAGNLLVSDVSNNIVYRAILSPDGVAMTARRAEPKVEFVASKDIWFRPVQFANAPDGTLYMIDMARELIEGAAFLPPELLKHINVASGMDKGRIYRLAPAGFKNPPSPKLGSLPTSELVALLESRNGWTRDTSARLIYERNDAAAVPQLRELVEHSKLPQARMHAMYCLATLKSLDSATILQRMHDAEANVRIHALRLAEKRIAEPEIRERLQQASNDPDESVRYQSIFSLGGLPVDQKVDRLVAHVKTRTPGRKTSSDRWLLVAIQSSLKEGAGEALQRLLDFPPDFVGKVQLSEIARDLAIRLARQIGASGNPHDLQLAVQTIDHLPQQELVPLAEELVLALVSSAKRGTHLDLPPTGRTSKLFAGILANAQRTAADASAKTEARVEAIRRLSLANYATAASVLVEQLTPQQPQEVQQAAVETLAAFDRPEVVQTILEAWKGFSPQVRTNAAEALLSRNSSTLALLEAIGRGDVSATEVDPVRAEYLQKHPDATLRQKAQQVLKQNRNAARAEVVAAYQKALQLKGNALRGKDAFKKNCSICHRLENVGTAIGADLAAIRNRGDAAILLNILDPNREVKPQYLSYVVTTKEGRIQTGLITGETANSLVVRRNDGTDLPMLRVDIDELKSTGLSFMPEGLEKAVDLQTMADLLAYFQSVK